MAKIKIGSLVSFNTLKDATWFEVVGFEGVFRLVIKEAGTDYATQTIDSSLVKKVK